MKFSFLSIFKILNSIFCGLYLTDTGSLISYLCNLNPDARHLKPH